jgi:hypothetical protein
LNLAAKYTNKEISFGLRVRHSEEFPGQKNFHKAEARFEGQKPDFYFGSKLSSNAKNALE